MTVLAFLTDPDVVAKILRHLRLPTSAPAFTAAKSTTPAPGFDLPEEDFASKQNGDDVGESHPQEASIGGASQAVNQLKPEPIPMPRPIPRSRVGTRLSILTLRGQP
jgi:hypothetical protein